jgi:hypothetical protein
MATGIDKEFHRGLLRNAKDETTVERRAGKPELVYGSSRPIALSRTGTRRIIIECPEIDSPPEAGYNYADCLFSTSRPLAVTRRTIHSHK